MNLLIGNQLQIGRPQTGGVRSHNGVGMEGEEAAEVVLETEEQKEESIA